MYPVHIQPLVHELLPEVEAVIGSVNNLFLEADKCLLEVIDLDDIQRRLIGQQRLILLVHNVLNRLLRLIQKVLVFEGGLVFDEFEDLEVGLELVAELMLEYLDLQVLQAHALRELLFYPLTQYRVEELEKEAAELVLILLYLFGLEIVFSLFDFFEIVFRIVSH